MRLMKYGSTLNPPLANTVKPVAISSGDTTCVPSASDSVFGNASVLKPNFAACASTASGPTLCSTRIDTRLRELHQRLAQPRRSAEILAGILRPPVLFLVIAAVEHRRHVQHTVAGVKPFSSAAEYRKGLNPDPGWRRACVTRLNLLR